MRTKAIKVLFYFLLIPIIGQLIFYLLPMISIRGLDLLELLMTIPVVNYVLFLIPTLELLFSFTHMYFLGQLLSLLLYLTFIVSGLLYFKENKILTKKKVTVLVVLTAIVICIPRISNAWLTRQSKQIMEEVNNEITEQSEAFSKVMSVEYLGTRDTSTLYYHNQERESLVNLKVSAITSASPAISSGLYHVCLTKTNESMDCVAETSITVSSQKPFFQFGSDLTTNIVVLNSEPNIYTANGNTMTLALPGIFKQDQKNIIAYLNFIYQEPGKYNERIIYSLPIKVPIEPTF